MVFPLRTAVCLPAIVTDQIGIVTGASGDRGQEQGRRPRGACARGWHRDVRQDRRRPAGLARETSYGRRRQTVEASQCVSIPFSSGLSPYSSHRETRSQSMTSRVAFPKLRNPAEISFPRFVTLAPDDTLPSPWWRSSQHESTGRSTAGERYAPSPLAASTCP